jgi:hypothetical protein
MSMRQRQKVQEMLRSQIAQQYLFACAANGIRGKIVSSFSVECRRSLQINPLGDIEHANIFKKTVSGRKRQRRGCAELGSIFSVCAGLGADSSG